MIMQYVFSTDFCGAQTCRSPDNRTFWARNTKSARAQTDCNEAHDAIFKQRKQKLSRFT